MRWNDLRQYIDHLRELGRLRIVRGATVTEDIGGISELLIESGGPAILFDDIPGYPNGYRVLANATETPAQLAIALGLDPNQPTMALAAEWARIIAGCTPI